MAVAGNRKTESSMALPELRIAPREKCCCIEANQMV